MPRCCCGAGRLLCVPSISIPNSVWHAGHTKVLRPVASDSLLGSVAPIHTARIQPLFMASLAATEASSHPQQGSVACSLSAVLTEASSQNAHSLFFLTNVFCNACSCLRISGSITPIYTQSGSIASSWPCSDPLGCYSSARSPGLLSGDINRTTAAPIPMVAVAPKSTRTALWMALRAWATTWSGSDRRASGSVTRAR